MSAVPFSTLEFYKGKTLFVTGTTGFVGKVLLEKVLRVLQIKRVYLLIRGKKGSELQERFRKEIISSKCFDRLRQIKGNDFEDFINRTVIPVDGDLLKPALGLSPEQRKEITANVNVIINSAASVDFNSPVRTALDINYFGCQKVLDLAKECVNLNNFCHISTAYVNSDKFGFLEEKIYNPEKDVEAYVQSIYKSTLSMDETKQKILLNKFPNTYTFTKNLAEQMLYQHKPQNMQITILRPTIVGCSMRDPFPGWIDNLVGGAAVMFFAGIGMVTIFKGDEKLISDQVPVDFVVDETLVVTAYEADRKSFQIYHCGTSARNPVIWQTTKETCLEYWNQNVPTVKVGPCVIEINNNLCYYRTKHILRKIPALAYKQMANLTGHKANQKLADRYLKVIDKADLINKTFKHFNRNEWIYSQENTLILMRSMSKEEQSLFLVDVTLIDWRSYLMNFHYGLQKYIMKENVDPPIDQEPTDLLRSWKSTNFADIQWVLKKQEIAPEQSRIDQLRNSLKNYLQARQRPKL